MPVSTRCLRFAVISTALLLSIQTAYAQAGSRRKVIIDQDCRGPATTDHQAILVFIQSPEVETLGITVGLMSGWEWARNRTSGRVRAGGAQLVLGGMCWPSMRCGGRSSQRRKASL